MTRAAIIAAGHAARSGQVDPCRPRSSAQSLHLLTRHQSGSTGPRTPMPANPSTDPLWFKDAVFYQLHVKSFADSNGDGIGDFAGLTAKLDHLESLGVDCLWIQPMYPSPFRDDGYDISDYTSIHPSYGTLEDFQTFLQQAHARGLRVIIELVAEPHLRPARRGSSRRAARPTIRAATGTSGATPTIATAAFASSSSTPSCRTGRGTRSPRPTTGTASSATSRTSTTTTRRCGKRSGR